MTSAAAVSSHDVSRPRIKRSRAPGPGPPHDQRVFAVVRVVAPADPARLEAELLVEADRGLVRDAHLERVAAACVARGDLEQALHQAAGDPAAAVLRRDRDVHHMPRVDVAGDDQVADELVPSARPRRGRSTTASRARPRTSSATTAWDTTCARSPRSRSGREASACGTRSSSERPVRVGDAHVDGLDELGRARSRVASRAWSRARGRCSSLSSGGTSPPASSSTSR